MRKLSMLSLMLATTPFIAGCDVPGVSVSMVNVSKCWSQETSDTVGRIVVPNLKDRISDALKTRGASDAQTGTLEVVDLQMSYEHPVKGDLAIGSVDCNASVKATVATPQHPKGVVLEAQNLDYSVYPGKNGAVVTASIGGFTDAVQSHIHEIIGLVLTAPEVSPPAVEKMQTPASAPALIPQQTPAEPPSTQSSAS